MVNIPSDDRLVSDLIAMRHETRCWAEQLLCNSFDLHHPTDILTLTRTDFPRSGQFPDSPWCYRIHGIGIDISKPNNRGGIDFDFDKPNVDRWRLREFIIKQLNDGAISIRYYRPLMQNAGRWSAAMDNASGV